MNEDHLSLLRQEIARLQAEKADREKALPAHSIRPHQLLAIEELEEEIEQRQKELAAISNPRQT
jgi:uncharacterized small protein (DUF1192 family)